MKWNTKARCMLIKSRSDDNKNAFLKYVVDREIGGDAFGIYGDCL